MNLKKIFFKKRYEKEQKELEEKILLKKQHEEENRIRNIFCAKSINEIPKEENPRDFVKLSYAMEINCPNSPEDAHGYTTESSFGPYFLTLKESGGFHFREKERHEKYGRKFIKISDLPVSLEKLIEDSSSHREKVETGRTCCSNTRIDLYTEISAGDGGLLIPQAIERINSIKKSKQVIGENLMNLSNLYLRLGKENIANELKKHYNNSILSKEKTSSLQIRDSVNFREESFQKKIFSKEAKNIQEYNSEIENLANKRNSELYELEREIRSSSSGQGKSFLTQESINKFKNEIIEKYDPKIKELYGKRKDEKWEEKVDSIKALERKYGNNPSSINQKEYKTLYRAARLARREIK